jgi:cation diffusion facilitator CzcD-associated flavoprotein CzcO
MRRLLLSLVKKQVGKAFDMKHFTPSYMPWDQRVCAVPDADLFEALKSGKASMVTDRIESFTETGLRLESGAVLDADIIVTATGLNLQTLGGMALSVDGEPRHAHDLMTYKGVLVQDLPNFATVFGYTNAPWTLKADLAGNYLCRLFAHMDAQGYSVVIPRDADGCRIDSSILGSLSSGYVQRGDGALPRQGSRYPWQVTHHFGRDTDMLLKQPVDDPLLRFLQAA